VIGFHLETPASNAKFRFGDSNQELQEIALAMGADFVLFLLFWENRRGG
jgi:hypothetical protein